MGRPLASTAVRCRVSFFFLNFPFFSYFFSFSVFFHVFFLRGGARSSPSKLIRLGLDPASAESGQGHIAFHVRKPLLTIYKSQTTGITVLHQVDS